MITMQTFYTSKIIKFSRYQQDAIDLTETVQSQVVKNTASVIKATLNARESLRVDGVDLKEITDFRQLFKEVEGMKNDDGTKMTFEDFLRAEAEGIETQTKRLQKYLTKLVVQNFYLKKVQVAGEKFMWAWKMVSQYTIFQMIKKKMLCE